MDATGAALDLDQTKCRQLLTRAGYGTHQAHSNLWFQQYVVMSPVQSADVCCTVHSS